MKLQWLVIGILGATALFGQAPAPDNGDNGPADEPGRAVARLAIVNGDASVRRGDSNEWVAAAVNAPLMTGDQVSVAAGGRAEIQIDAAHYLRVGPDTELRLADLENGHYQVQISHGSIAWRVLRDSQAQAEIDTPLVGVHPGAQSMVRVEVDQDGSSHITVRRGGAEVSTQKGSEQLTANNTMDVRGDVNDPEFQVVAAAGRDDFDNWSDQRDNYLLKAQSQRYVTEDVHGVEDLDSYGRWDYDPAYGWVWAPQVAAGWAPYQDGRWVWEDYYGWTWVDYSPWGWAPFHYGYWYNRVGYGWSWYPGSRVGHVWWRPAMVGFFGWGGGVSVGFGFSNIGWVPLGPREVFRPWYGRGYHGGVIVARDVSVTSFRNAGYARGVTAVDFQRGNFRNSTVVDRGTLARASFVHGTVPMTPTAQNLRFSNRVASVGGASVARQRFYGNSPAAGARRTPFVQQQNNVRAAVTGQRQPLAGRSPAQNPNWSRFQSRPAGANTPTPSAPRLDRFGGVPGRQAAPAQMPAQNAPRRLEVSPQILRQRPEANQQRNDERPQAPRQASPQGGGGGPRGGGFGGGSAPRGGHGGGPAGGNGGHGRR
ncbi:MAG TPA: DUF6600 domain-containing protein [Bryobacteraceae bacterium]|nr:DUF6600 domain-containing protein [Bryobacteraceae bacterium]